MAEVMKLSYLIDPKVKGVVNIHTSGQISSDDVFPVFQIDPSCSTGPPPSRKDSSMKSFPSVTPRKCIRFLRRLRMPRKTLSEEKYVIQIIPLKYIPVTEVSKMIKPFLSDGADIIEHPPQNILLDRGYRLQYRKVC